jgi:photosystem II PsbU protein
MLGGINWMKTLVRVIAVLALMVATFGFGSNSQAGAVDLSSFNLQSSPVLAVEASRRNLADEKLKTEFGQKIDLNNSDIRDFRELRGFYPNLASKIIQNAPYEKVEDVLEIPGLSERQQARLQANLDNFTVTEPSDVYIQGGDRINPGVY